MRGLLLCAAALLSGCSFLSNANELKGRGKIDLLFPFDLIPGLESVLPHIVLDVSGGMEWHNDREQHEFELEMLRAKAETEPTNKETGNENLEAVFLRSLRDAAGSAKL